MRLIIIPRLRGLIVSAFAVVGSLVVGAFLIASIGANPLRAYQLLVEGSFGSTFGLTEMLVKAAPLLLVALGLSIAFSAGFWNVGAEGQLLMGTVAATGLGLVLVDIPSLVLLPVIFFASFLFGAFWAGIPATLRVKLQVNEIITTLLLNFVALLIVSYLISGPWKEPEAVVPQTPTIVAAAQLPRLIRTRLHAGIILPFIIVPLVGYLLSRTSFGYEIRVTGKTLRAAHYGGVNVSKIVFLAAVVSGGLAGIAGMNEVVGIHYRLLDGISPGFGFTAVAVTLLGRLRPIGVLFSSIFFAFLINGADAMQRGAGVPVTLTIVIQGLAVLFLIGGELIRRSRI